jgi:PAS domain S-box-containing protein
MRRLRFDVRSLSAQMILSLVALVLLTAVAAGLPALWLLQGQLERQAWAQVDQGSRAAQALYTARQGEVNGLATLAAQRPTLRELLVAEELGALQDYLHTLQTGAGLSLVLVCDRELEVVAQAGAVALDVRCAREEAAWIHVAPDGAWLIAAHPVSDPAAGALGTVVVGLALDDDMAMQMRAQTGLEHTVWADGRPIATSLPGDVTRRQLEQPSPQESTSRLSFSQDGRPYYAAQFALEPPAVTAEVALPVGDVVATWRHLAWTLAGSTLAVAAVGSLLGAFLARRIGQPLSHLADAASALSQGDLSHPVAVEARVREVTLVAQALEGARADLQRTLDELRQEKAWADHLLEAIVEGIVTLDRRGHITFFSQGAERITGWQRDQVLGHSCDQVFQPIEMEEPFSQLIPAPGQRRKISVELRDGRQAILAITGARLLPLESGDARVALVFRDISEEEAVHRLLGHFLANIAHEFRTPLSALAASVELLLDQAPDLTADELQELLTSLHLGILGLQTLVDNLLESASIEAGHFHVSPRAAHLGEIIAEAIRTMQPLLDKRGQWLTVELPAAIPVVRTDPRRTVQVLVNLLSNASKYGPDDAEIAIGAAVDDGWVRVRVADRGPGILPKQRGSLFRQFSRPGVENDRAQVGAGLGLWVVKTVVEAHGGQVGVDERPGGGAVFWFTLPVEDG